MFTVQNYLNSSVYVALCVAEGKGEEVVFAGGGSKHKGGSYDMMSYSNVQYHETLKWSVKQRFIIGHILIQPFFLNSK